MKSKRKFEKENDNLCHKKGYNSYYLQELLSLEKQADSWINKPLKKKYRCWEHT